MGQFQAHDQVVRRRMPSSSARGVASFLEKIARLARSRARLAVSGHNRLEHAASCLILGCCLLGLAGTGASAEGPSLSNVATEHSGLPAAPRVAYRAIPITFESNAGQLPPGVHARAFGAPLSTYLTRNGTTVIRSRPSRTTSLNGLRAARAGDTQEAEQYSLALVNAAATGTPEMEAPVATRSNYLIGSDPAKWITNVAHYQRVRYRSVYPGIDQLFHASTGQLEYDLVLAPGADADAIRLRVSGAHAVDLTTEGDISVRTADTTLLHKKPVAYQETATGKSYVDATYELRENGDISIRLGAYDHGKTLTIDPVLSYSTFFYIGYAQFTGVAVDAAGGAYVVGTVSGNNILPLQNPIETYVDVPASYAHDADNSGDNILVAKFAPSGTSLEYATFLGSSLNDRSGGIAVTPAGEAVIAAVVTGTDYPVVNALYRDAAADPRSAAFNVVSALSQDGSSLRYSYYLSARPFSSTVDNGLDPRVAIAPNGSVWIAGIGQRSGATIPQPPLIETTYHCGNALLWRIAADGTHEDFTKCLAGSYVSGLAVDSSGNAYVSGSANSEFFSRGPISPRIDNPSPFDTAVWIDKIDAAGANVIYHATLAGGGADGGGTTFSNRGVAVAADSTGNAYLTGFTPWPTFPVVNVRDQGLMTTGLSGGVRKQFAFVTKINPTGTSIPYSTFLNLNLSSDTQVFVSGIAVDGTGHAFVAGSAGRYSGTFAGIDAYNLQDAFVVKLDNQGRSVLNDYRLGGSRAEFYIAFALGAHNEMYVAGLSLSPDFPFVNSLSGWSVPFSDSSAGGASFFAKFTDDPTPAAMTIAPSRNPVPIRTDIVFTASVPGASGSINWFVDDRPVGVSDLVFGKRVVAFTLGGMTRGTYQIRAEYVPDDTSLPTLSATISQQVLLPEDCM